MDRLFWFRAKVQIISKCSNFLKKSVFFLFWYFSTWPDPTSWNESVSAHWCRGGAGRLRPAALQPTTVMSCSGLALQCHRIGCSQMSPFRFGKEIAADCLWCRRPSGFRSRFQREHCTRGDGADLPGSIARLSSPNPFLPHPRGAHTARGAMPLPKPPGSLLNIGITGKV